MAPPTLPISQYLGHMLLGGLLVAGSMGGGIYLGEFNSNGTVNPTAKEDAWEPINVVINATGSTTIQYPAFCLPVSTFGFGSGFLALPSLGVQNNPTGAHLDVGFTKGCAPSFGSGSSLFNDAVSASGSNSVSATMTVMNGADYIKGTFNKYPGPAFLGRFRGFVGDIYGR